MHQGPLTDFVPAAGVRWLVIGKPRELARIPWVATALSGLLPEERLDAYAATSGIELRTLPNALVAGFDFATLYMAEVHGEEPRIEERFEERLVGGAKANALHENPRTLQGVVGKTPETLLVIDRQLVAVSVGDPTPIRVAEAFAKGRLKRSPTVLAGSALRTLPSDLEQAPLRFYAPGPFEGEWAHAARGLLGAALAVGAAVRPAEEDFLRAELVITGNFEPSGPGASAELLAAWNDLAQSSTGHLLGLDDPESPPEISAASDRLRLEKKLRLSTLVQGLRAAVSADVREILDIGPAPEFKSSHPSTQKR